MLRLLTLVSSLRFLLRSIVLLSFSVITGFLVSSSAQQQSDGSTNLPAFGSFSGSDFDIVSLQNGNLHISIPILSVPQRGGKSIGYMFLYDTPDFNKTLYTPTQGSPYWFITPDTLYTGWSLSNTLNWGLYTEWENSQYKCPDSDIKYTLTTLGVVDPQRAKHPFYLLTSTASCFGAQLVAPALDGSGMLLNLTTNGPGLMLKDGTRPGIEDVNGNLFSATADTLGRDLVTVTYGPTISFTSPLGQQASGPQYQTWTYTDSNGVSQVWTLNNEAIDINTSAGLCPTGTIKCVDPVKTAIVVPQYLHLPTGAFYQFVYNNNSSGELQQIILPTGGSISYTYSGYKCIANPLTPQGEDCRVAVSTRTVSQGGTAATWKYNLGTGTLGTVTDPYGNDEVHTFNYQGDSSCTSAGSYETQVQTWSGSSASGGGGTVLKTVTTTYTGEDVFTISGGVLCYSNVRPISQTITINGASRLTQTDYETFNAGGGYTATRMNVTAFREYDYTGSLLRQTKNLYGLNSNSAYTNLNIVDRVTQKTVYDSGNNQIAQTTYEYDNYSHTGQPMVASSAVQHDTAFGTSNIIRGNVTAVSRWRNSDGALLTTTNQYDDAGNVLSSIDPLGDKTAFDFTDSWSNSTCAPSGQGKAYVTKITNALSQITSKTYNSCSGALASTTDANLQPTTYSYDLLRRATSVSYPDGGNTTYCYTDTGGTGCTSSGPPYQVVTTKAITSSLKETSTVLFDGLGRTSQTQLNSDTSVDYVDTTYDLVGRKSTVSNPYRSTSSTTDGTTTYVYDALGRVCAVGQADGAAISQSSGCPTTGPRGDVFTQYASNCTTVTDEVGNSRQSCVDGLGRVTKARLSAALELRDRLPVRRLGKPAKSHAKRQQQR